MSKRAASGLTLRRGGHSVLGKPLRPGAGAGGAWRAGGSPPALPGPRAATEAAAAGSPPRASSRPPPQTPPLAFCREPSVERDTPTLRRVYPRPRKCQKTGFRGRTHRGTLPSGPRVDAGDAGGDRGLRPGKEPAGPGRRHRGTAAVTPPVAPSEMRCRYTPTLLGALKLSGAS